MDIKLDDESLAALQSLLNEPSVQSFMRDSNARDRAASLRGEVTANWLDSFLTRMSLDTNNQLEPHLINEATGQLHTVESMVNMYKEQVGLDNITKSADLKIPLSLKASNHGVEEMPTKKEQEAERARLAEVLEDMKKDISHMITSHRGYVDTPAAIYEVREKYGLNEVNALKSELLEFIEAAKEEYMSSNPDVKLPEAGQGMPIRVEHGKGVDDDIFMNIRERG